ncbi:MAG: alanine--glyoxylate aminotransferase family protein [Gemmatimonadetes bacterium]|nr:alanine--glyoxylate aminotransferase family protein [Gemmatimonadota bacterium]
MSGGLPPGRFFLPGPTEVDAEVLAAQVTAMYGHRTDACRAVLREVDEGLRPFFGTTRPVLIGTLSATGFMEAAVRSGTRASVLSVVNGAFSGRFAQIAERCGRSVERLDVPWGRAIDPEVLDRRLSRGGVDAVTVVHSETSTGALAPLAAIGEVVGRYPDVLLLVDSVTGVGATPVRAEDWGLDVVLTGSQKGLAMPPGLAFAAVSERLLERARDLPDRGYYLDLVRYVERADDAQTPTTPALTLLHAAREQAHRMRAETPDGRFARHRALADACASAVGRWRAGGMDVSVLAPVGERSPTVTCIELPPVRGGPEVVAGVRERGYVIGGGYGRLEQRTIRIGHMGDHSLEALAGVLEAVEAELHPGLRA